VGRKKVDGRKESLGEGLFPGRQAKNGRVCRKVIGFESLEKSSTGTQILWRVHMTYALWGEKSPEAGKKGDFQPSGRKKEEKVPAAGNFPPKVHMTYALARGSGSQ
jgi:hypothetical protein